MEDRFQNSPIRYVAKQN